MVEEYIAYLKDNPQGYWFKARLYGWGWAPAKKEGWLVLLVYIAVIIVAGLLGGSRVENGEQFLKWYLPLIIISTAILLGICYKKGERPRWQWGPPKDKK